MVSRAPQPFPRGTNHGLEIDPQLQLMGVPDNPFDNVHPGSLIDKIENPLVDGLQAEADHVTTRLLGQYQGFPVEPSSSLAMVHQVTLIPSARILSATSFICHGENVALEIRRCFAPYCLTRVFISLDDKSGVFSRYLGLGSGRSMQKIHRFQ